MRSYPSWIAGIKYTGPDGTDRGKYCARYLSTGAVLELVPEPDNPHSTSGLAVAIKHQGHHLGYVPARHDWVGSALLEGKTLSCVVNQIETKGWLFRRARHVALNIYVSDHRPAVPQDPQAVALSRHREARAREACINGLRVLAYIALSDNELSEMELAIQASYIGARLASAGLDRDDELTESMLTLAQGLSVPHRSFVRALNAVTADRQHYALVIDAALRITSARGSLSVMEAEALKRLQTVCKKQGWI